MKTFKDINRKETDLEEACWVGYKKVGMKKKGDRMVPNCVKEELVNAVYGKDYIYREPVMEAGVGDMYKGKLSATQLTNLKNLWKNKRQSDVTPSVKSYVKGLDQFTKMDIKQANIKYLSNLIDSVQKEKVDFISPLSDQIEIVEMNSVVRKTELKEFNSDQIERLAKAYSMMKDKTISIDNAKRLGRMMDNVPTGSLNALRKKKIPFLSGLALNRMIKLKMPVTEDVSCPVCEGEKCQCPQEKSLVEDRGFTLDQIRKAKTLAKYYANDMTTAVKNIEKLGKELSKHPDVAHALKKANESIEIDEGLQIAKLVGKSIAHLEMYLELANDVKKIPIGDISSWLKSKAEQASKSVPPLIKDLRKPGIWNEELQEAVKAVKFWEDKQLEEADLSKSQVKQVHKQADELPKKDFIKKYGKDGDAVRYATATNQIKNKLGIGENKFKLKGELTMNESYKLKLNKAMEHYKIDSLAELKDEDQKPFFAYVDGLKEELSAAQKKLPPALQKAIAAKQGDKKEDDKEVKEGEMPQAALDALKKSKEKKEDLVGGQKKLDKDKDGDIDGKDFAALRKDKKEVKESDSHAKPEVTAKDSNDTAHLGGDQKEKKDTDMSKVKDAPAKSEPHKKIEADKKMTEDHDCDKTHPGKSHKEYTTNEIAKEYMNMSASKNKMKTESHGKYLQTKPGSLEEAVLIARGLIK